MKSFLDPIAPAERLAMFRISAGGFTLLYLLIRFRVFLQLANNSADAFEGVGVFAVLDSPMPPGLVPILFGATLISGGTMTVGYRYRVAAPIFSVLVLVLTSYRSSWGQLLHFEHLFTLHLLVLAFAPAADALSLDARRSQIIRNPSVRYGFPVQIGAIVVVVSYVIAGIAKLRYGGLDWIFGDTLRHHIAYSAARLDLLGGTPSPFAKYAVAFPALLPFAAGLSVVIEFAAPLALLGGRWRTGWVAVAWAMHLATFALMLVAFPYPFFLVGFAPLFELERFVPLIRRWGLTRPRRPV